jgi:oligopeptide transport system ATP-binding protein
MSAASAASVASVASVGSAAPLLEVRDLAVHFPVRRGLLGRTAGVVRAVDGVSFTLGAGETLGLVGESGCGKSTTARAVIRLVPATRGSVRLGGQDLLALEGSALRRARRDVQMIFQDPYASLDPRLTVEQSVAEPLEVHGIFRSAREAAPEVTRLLAQVGLDGAYAGRYPNELSGGQRQRVGIARALALKPKVVLADEPVSALDVSVRAQIVELLAALQRDHGLAYLFVAHDLAVVRRLSHRVAVMYLGRIVELAPTAALFAEPAHPYTRALLAAVPVPDPTVERGRRRLLLAGEVPRSPGAAGVGGESGLGRGCAFQPRCPEAVARCAEEAPRLLEHAKGRSAACHLVTPTG